MRVTLSIEKWREIGKEQSNDHKQLREMFSDYIMQDPADDTKYIEYFDIEIVIPNRNAAVDQAHMTFLTDLVKNIVHSYEIESELFAEEDDDELHHMYANESHMILNLQGAKVQQVIAWIKCLHSDGNKGENAKPAVIRFERVIKKQQTT